MQSILTTMSNNNTGKRHCATCGKGGGVLICHGCQSAYCARHVVKHRQELGNKLENLMQDHDLLQQDIGHISDEYFYLQKIDKWERESIKKIQIAAETARVDLRRKFDKSTRRLTKISRDIASDLHSSRKTDDFSEKDLTRWMQQLNDLRSDIKSSYSLHLIEDQQSPISLVTIASNYSRDTHKNQLKLNPDECFSQVTHSASIENNGMTVKHTGRDLDHAHILGKKFYSQGRHTTRFNISQSASPYIIFFGCISSERKQKLINYTSSFVVGWFGYNEIYQHGIWNNNLTMHGYDSSEIETNDILHLTFDCDQKQIELYHERLNKTHKLVVNIEKAPFPWQILVVLVHEDDCVKILPKR
jgi:hypothetical protein